MKLAMILLMLCVLAGCGSGTSEHTPVIVTLLTVKDARGTQRQIPSSELYGSTQEDYPVVEILVLDRQTNKQQFVPLDQIPSATQTTARYIPVTTSQTEHDP